jgi:hypothetical protein
MPGSVDAGVPLSQCTRCNSLPANPSVRGIVLFCGAHSQLEVNNMKRFLSLLTLGTVLLAAAPVGAQTLGTFRWQLRTYGSVVHLTVTQNGSHFLLSGFEAQCGGNLSLPVSGVAVVQENGTVVLGFTTINENGRGIHTRATINMTNFNGTWSDNAGNTDQEFFFNPGNTCPGGPRTGPTSPDSQKQ